MTATISGDGTSTLINLTTSGNTVLGDASTDTLNVGNGGLVKNASGNVGIGTSSPTDTSGFSRAIDLNGTSGAGYYARTNGSSTNYTLFGNYGADGYINNRGAGSLIVYNNNAERMRIDSSGNLLVGTTSVITLGKISTSFDGVTQYGATFKTVATVSGSSFLAFVNSAGTIQGSVYANATNTVQYLTSSDYRLKENIVPMVGALEKVAQLKPCTYTWKADGSSGKGFIAHELAEVAPECVGGEKDAVDAEGKPRYQGVDTSFLVATLTAAIQEMKAIIDTQASTITQLQADVEALKAQP